MSTIMSTMDYNKFKTLKGNRQISKAHINRLVGAYKENTEAIQYNPILVNENYEIIDGQHRFTALSTIGLPIYYIQQEGLDLEDAQKLNSLVKTWSPKDYAHAYAENGNKDYQIYLDVAEQYPFGFKILIQYLAGIDKYPTTDMFRNGTFKVGNLPKALGNLDKLVATGDLYKDYKRKGFGEALLLALSLKEFNFKRFLNKLGKDYAQKKLRPFDNRAEYLRCIESIYNHHQPKSDQLYFNSRLATN